MRLTRPSWSAYALIMGRCCTGYTAISGGMPGMTHSYQTQMGCLRLLRDTNPPLVMAASRLKCHQKKCAGFVVEGVRNVRYDTPRTGDFRPLRHVLPQHTVVLGLLTTKSAALEDASAVEARIREASQYVPLERLALSPQCGFASVEAGNPLTPADQEAKLRLVSEVARRVWHA